MKIIHALEAIDPASGGPVKSASALAAAQAMLGHDVRLVCYREHNHAAFSSLVRASLPEPQQLDIVALEDPWLERISARSASRSFERLAGEADVVHVHGVWRPFTLAASKAALRAGSQLVISPRGMLDPWSLRQKSLKKRLALGIVWRRVLDAASFIHALNETEARLINLLGLESPLRVFPNGAFPERFAPIVAPESLASKAPALRGRRYVLFMSRLHHKKGLDFLIGAFARVAAAMSDVDLVIAGSDDGARSELEQHIEQHALRARVHLVGSLHGPEQLAALAGAECFCLPSRQEGFSMAIIEALASGTPVVISEQCHFPEVAAAGAGLVVRLEEQDIAAAIISVLNDREARARMSAGACELIRTHYDWREIARRMIAAYECDLEASRHSSAAKRRLVG